VIKSHRSGEGQNQYRPHARGRYSKVRRTYKQLLLRGKIDPKTGMPFRHTPVPVVIGIE